MIDKLYDLKKLQIEQHLIEKNQLDARIITINEDIQSFRDRLIRTTVSPHGAISDFVVLQMHKETMKNHMVKLEQEKKRLQQNIEMVLEQIVQLEKEKEQFDYVLQEEKKLKLKTLLKIQEDQAQEFVQNRYQAG